ncbi:MAG: hypothetical protein EZS28_046272 [Streblomastix strix]|uniref:Transmembrane protein n=1 Tax=Streblomastix strix TaxID=222440 RepID=A0A5J4TL04_9EUKA|nr:MAG: hypothetical protein EZS28_046272 [Streblomastix strix]
MAVVVIKMMMMMIMKTKTKKSMKMQKMIANQCQVTNKPAKVIKLSKMMMMKKKKLLEELIEKMKISQSFAVNLLYYAGFMEKEKQQTLVAKLLKYPHQKEFKKKRYWQTMRWLMKMMKIATIIAKVIRLITILMIVITKQFQEQLLMFAMEILEALFQTMIRKQELIILLENQQTDEQKTLVLELQNLTEFALASVFIAVVQLIIVIITTIIITINSHLFELSYPKQQKRKGMDRRANLVSKKIKRTMENRNSVFKVVFVQELIIVSVADSMFDSDSDYESIKNGLLQKMKKEIGKYAENIDQMEKNSESWSLNLRINLRELMIKMKKIMKINEVLVKSIIMVKDDISDIGDTFDQIKFWTVTGDGAIFDYYEF